MVHRVMNGHSESEFRWATPTHALLDSLEFKPQPLRNLICIQNAGIVYLVHREAS